MTSRFVVVAAALALSLSSSALAAGAGGGDGAYGRFDGDVSLVMGLGGGVLSTPRRGFGSAELRVRYLEAVGATFVYEEAEALAHDPNPTFRRGFAAGIEVRPLFPARFLKAYEHGPAFFDLVLDSIGLDLAAYFGAGAYATQRPGLQAGLALELPLAAQANGPWLRLGGAVRWSSLQLEGDGAGDVGGRTLVLTASLAWHQVIAAHVVDWHDRHLD